MDSTTAQRRLGAIQGHLVPDGESHSQLLPNPTAGEFSIGTFPLSWCVKDWFMAKVGVLDRGFTYVVPFGALVGLLAYWTLISTFF